jgi:hypothetical protein
VNIHSGASKSRRKMQKVDVKRALRKSNPYGSQGRGDDKQQFVRH